MDAPSDVNCPARQCLQLLVVLRRLAPSGTCPSPGGLKVGSA